MAVKGGSVERKVKLKFVTSGIKKAGNEVRAFGELSRNAFSQIKTGALALAGLAVAADKAVSSTLHYDNVLRNIPFSLSKARAASRGWVSELDLGTKAIEASRLGAARNAEEFAVLTKAAFQLSLSLGRDMTAALSDLVTGMGRGSKLILDNLNIIVDSKAANEEYAKSLGVTANQLSDAGKKQALVNAAYKEAERIAKGVTVSVDKNVDSWKKAKKSMSDFAVVAARDLANSAGMIASSLGEMGRAFDSLAQKAMKALDIIRFDEADVRRAERSLRSQFGAGGRTEQRGFADQGPPVPDSGHIIGRGGGRGGGDDDEDVEQRTSFTQVAQFERDAVRAAKMAATRIELFIQEREFLLDRAIDRHRKHKEEQIELDNQVAENRERIHKHEMEIEKKTQASVRRNTMLKLSLVDKAIGANMALASSAFHAAVSGETSAKRAVAVTARGIGEEMALQAAAETIRALISLWFNPGESAAHFANAGAAGALSVTAFGISASLGGFDRYRGGGGGGGGRGGRGGGGGRAGGSRGGVRSEGPADTPDIPLSVGGERDLEVNASSSRGRVRAGRVVNVTFAEGSIKTLGKIDEDSAIAIKQGIDKAIITAGRI